MFNALYALYEMCQSFYMCWLGYSVHSSLKEVSHQMQCQLYEKNINNHLLCTCWIMKRAISGIPENLNCARTFGGFAKLSNLTICCHSYLPLTLNYIKNSFTHFEHKRFLLENIIENFFWQFLRAYCVKIPAL